MSPASPYTFAAHTASLILPVLLPGVVLIAALARGWWRTLDRPVDGGAQFRGRALLGRTKTWRGVAIYLLGGMLVGALLAWPAAAGATAEVFGRLPVPLAGAAVGLAVGGAYCFGEFINSFVKRRLGLDSSEVAAGSAGSLQYAIDLCDGILVASALYLLLGVPPALVLATAIAGVGVHALTDVVMRALRLKTARAQQAR